MLSTRTAAFAAVLATAPVFAITAFAADPAPLCADAGQTNAVRALYASPPAPPPFLAGAQLELPDAVVLSALPAAMAVGTGGQAFVAVWQSLQA
jgi:hypothetical protein